MPSNRISRRTLVAAGSFALAAPAILRSRHTGASQPIRIGACYNTSGSQAILDQPSLDGARLAVEVLNAAGSLISDGRPVELVVLEGNSDILLWDRRIETALADHPSIAAFIGLSDTDNVIAAAGAAARHGRPFVTSGATSPKLAQQVPTWLYLACFGDNVQAAAGAEYAYDSLGARQVSVLYDPNLAYPSLLHGYFQTRFAELGGEMPVKAVFDPRAHSLLIPEIRDPDLIYLSVETAEDAVRCLGQLRERGYAGPVLGGDGYDAESVWADHPALDQVFFTTHANLGPRANNPQTADFVTRYRERYDAAPSAFSALGYDALNLVAAAIRIEQASEPGAVLEGLAKISNFRGITGSISYANPHGEPHRIPRKSVTVMQAGGGEEKFLAELTPRSVPSP